MKEMVCSKTFKYIMRVAKWAWSVVQLQQNRRWIGSKQCTTADSQGAGYAREGHCMSVTWGEGVGRLGKNIVTCCVWERADILADFRPLHTLTFKWPTVRQLQ